MRIKFITFTLATFLILSSTSCGGSQKSSVDKRKAKKEKIKGKKGATTCPTKDC
jgi:hypothetical protein